MSGIFGIFGFNEQTEIRSTMEQMARAMTHFDWHVAEFYVDEQHSGGIGRIGIGIFNRSLQPLWNASRSVALVMAGEVYNKKGGEDGSIPSDEQYVLDLYEQNGLNFVTLLEGVFVIAIWDFGQKCLVVVNDRLGLYPLYFYYRKHHLCFAPEIKGVLCDKTVPRTLDMVALAQYLRFQHLLGTRTFFEEIRLLPGASLLVWDMTTGEMKIDPYWTFAEIPFRPEISFNEAVEETGQLLRRAVKRLSEDDLRPGVFLSGGLDSRTLAGLIERRPLVTMTYGSKNSRDVYYAERIARAIGSDHHWFDLPDGQWVLKYVDTHLELTEGFHSWIHMHGISMLQEARRWVEVNLTGWDGGTIMGHPEQIQPHLISPVNDETLLVHLFYLFNQKYSWPSLTEAEGELIFTDSHKAEMRGLAFDSFRSELTPFLHLREDIKAELFFIRNHCMRLTHNMVTMYRAYVEVRFPFFDQQLFDFMYSLPAQLRAERKLYFAVLTRVAPRLSWVPYDHDELLPTANRVIRDLHELGVKIRRRVNRHVYPIFPQRETLYANYEDYLRKDLRSWAENILFDRRTLERGLFNPQFLRSLFERHLNGNEEWTIGKIAPIITYEMALRRFLD